ncbi:hypothetical protein T11_9233 [Trichinella zimbabwensis]|uniref:SCAN domain-containing protein 3 n=1 Tax=Trichinella zimbabwensis TaxID=268475 RepID=A0A0V1H6A9_9BILA|nr:hypothetical protein T11_9233 [Trichinella zimbabwensis]
MASDVEDTLCNFLRTAQFSLSQDESTLPGNEAYAYYCLPDHLVTNTTGQSIFLVVEEFFEEKDIPLTNLITVATDGALEMVGYHRGFIAYLKKSVPNVLAAIHAIHI